MLTRKFISFLAVSLLVAGFLSPEYRAFASLPSSYVLPSGDHLDLKYAPGLGWAAHGGVEAVSTRPARVLARQGGEIALTLAGVSLKRVGVRIAERHTVTLGGQAIGVVVRGRGTTVVGLDRIPTLEGTSLSPGREAGLRVGDRLIAVDGKQLGGDHDLAVFVDIAGRAHRSLRLLVARGESRLHLSARPVFDRQLGRYRLGVFVRDRTAGVGTLTFSDAARKRFAALGHRVALSRNTAAPQTGIVLPAAIVGLERATRGRPGQKIGVIRYGVRELGRIQRNGEVGVGGELSARLQGKRIPIATVSQVHPGEATLFTVLQGEGVRGYRMRIERVTTNRRAGAKSLVVRVTDRRLLRRTGGIVQGMSGSPIVQDGHLAGAVTHVFIHDPTRGYGTFAQWMYEDLVVARASPDADRRSA